MSNVTLQNIAQQEAAVSRQRRNSSLASLGISILVIVLIMLVLALVLMPNFSKEAPVVVAYSAPTNKEQEEQKKLLTRQQPKPSAPSASMSPVIAAQTTSPTAIPVPEVNVDTVSFEFGSGDDFDAGWETGEAMGGEGGGETTFFKQKVSAARVAYVIDTSRSMNKQRQELMREELIKSIKQLKPGMEYQIIYFSAPAWVAGSELDLDFEEGEATVKDENGTFEWKASRRGKGGNYSGWVPKGKEQKAGWLELNSRNRRQSIKDVEEVQMTLGTDWGPPLRMALDMDPAPQIIFFMTDGVGGNTEDLLDELGRLARRKKAVINTISLMEPKAVDGLIYLAKKTDGQFTIVNERGKAEVQELD